MGDVTFIPTRAGWLYLAVLLDLQSRKLVGWAMSHRNDQSSVENAVQMAIQARCPAPGLIHHTDQGSTYSSQRYRNLLEANGVRSSMSRNDRPPAFEPCRMWEFEHIRQPGEQKSLAVFCPVIDVA